jgi:hypothetical protein
VLGVLGQVIEAGDVKAEFLRFGKLPEAGARTEKSLLRSILKQLLPADISCQLGDSLSQIVHSKFDHPKNPRILWVIDEELDVGSKVLAQFLKEDFDFLFGQGAHNQNTYLFNCEESEYICVRI